MPLSSRLFRVLRILIPLSTLSLTYIYLYPIFHLCAFPQPQYAPRRDARNASTARSPIAPFRLLALGDPQLEGDSSLPGLDAHGRGLLPSLWPLRTRDRASWDIGMMGRAARGLVTEDVPRLMEFWKKSLDLWGNDYYLAHIYRTMDWWAEPTHLVVLGDLLGSQWVADDEFERRSDRFWGRVFRGTEKVSEHFMSMSLGTDEDGKQVVAEETETLGADAAWRRRAISVAGNHDIGYAGDIDERRVERFERRFGKVNWSVRFSLAPHDDDDGDADAANARTLPTLRLVVLNSMNLDTPVRTPTLQSQTYDFLNAVILSQPRLPASPDESDTSATILLTHIPLHKRAGLCADAPFFDYFSGRQGDGVKEQNHLSEHASRFGPLEGVFGLNGDPNAPARGLGRRGLLLTGHDHVGCDVWHFWNRTASATRDGESDGAGDEHDGDGPTGRWDAVRWADAGELVTRHREALRSPDRRDEMPSPGLREVTVRSMMGEFGGNAGLVSAWFDDELRQWRFEYASCSVRVQHIWWAVHVLVLFTLLTLVAAVLAGWLESLGWPAMRRTLKVEEPKKSSSAKSEKRGGEDALKNNGRPKVKQK